MSRKKNTSLKASPGADKAQQATEAAASANKQAVVSPSTTQVVTPPTAIAVESEEKNLFKYASVLNASLAGLSNKEVLKVLTLVSSIHGYRVISVDRNINQQQSSSTERAIALTHSTIKPKGKKTSPAAYKQTDAYKHLTANRLAIVNTMHGLTPQELSQTTFVADLREIERKLKDLKLNSQSGN
jgi:hypothetical protein